MEGFNRRLRRFAQIRKGYHARLKSIRYSEPQGRASRPRHAATRCDRRAAHTRHCNANSAYSATHPPLRKLLQSGADIPVCARHEADRNVCPTLVPRYVKSCISPRTRRSAQRECLGRGADGGVSDREPFVSPRAARSRFCLRACGYWPGRNRSTRPHPHADGSRDVS